MAIGTTTRDELAAKQVVMVVPRTETVSAKLAECARSMSGTFSRQEIVSWFRRHYPEVKESTLAAHIQAYTANATNRERHHPGISGRVPLFVRVGHGAYRRYDAGPERVEGPSGISPAIGERVTSPNRTGELAAVEEWSWEGNVQATLVTFLAASGWQVTRVADTASRERGTDIEAVRGGIRLLVEVKGWPSRKYVDPVRAGEQKPTSPALMARSWFADGLMHVLRLRTSHSDGLVLLALPSYDTYRRLWEGVGPAARNAGVDVVWVDSDGPVEGESAVDGLR